MAGIPHGKIECFHSVNEANTSQEMFKSWYDFMKNIEAFGYVSEIALQYGSGEGTTIKRFTFTVQT